MTHRHPLETKLNASAAEILSAIERGARAIVDVKGKLAEYFLDRQLAEWALAKQIDRHSWTDADGAPDFEVFRKKRRYLVECKNVRTGAASPKYPAARVELQKTRNSKDGTPTRGYGVDEFQVLAACLFNQTGKWTFVFAATAKLERRPGDPKRLTIMQSVPIQPAGWWHATLLEALVEVP